MQSTFITELLLFRHQGCGLAAQLCNRLGRAGPPSLLLILEKQVDTYNLTCRSAEEAARRRNGYEFANLRMRVEIARGGDGASVNQPLRTGYRPIRNTMGYRLYVKGLPRTASWQDLKVWGLSVPGFTLLYLPATPTILPLQARHLLPGLVHTRQHQCPTFIAPRCTQR